MIQKLIDAYELEREMYRKCIDTDEEIEKGRAKWDSGLWIRYKVFEDAITLAPRVEAEPVRHGMWKRVTAYEGGDFHFYECSICGEPWWFKMNYCAKCGAKLDKEEL